MKERVISVAWDEQTLHIPREIWPVAGSWETTPSHWNTQPEESEALGHFNGSFTRHFMLTMWFIRSSYFSFRSPVWVAECYSNCASTIVLPILLTLNKNPGQQGLDEPPWLATLCVCGHPPLPGEINTIPCSCNKEGDIWNLSLASPGLNPGGLFPLLILIYVISL